MEHSPLMNIHFPPASESGLHDEMKARAIVPWSSQPFNPFGKKLQEGYFFFHRNVVGEDPSCTVCIHREKPGHWCVVTIVPDEGQLNPIPVQLYKKILSAFDAEVAEPAANVMQGMTAIEVSEFRLQDYLSPKAVELLRRFCSTSNQGDGGSHPSDQEKWIAFLICAYDDGHNVHCDIFGEGLKNASWWPESGISRLVREYDFALQVLKISGR